MKRSFVAVILLALAGLTGPGVAPAGAGEVHRVNPVIQSAGGMVPLPDAGMQPDRNTDYKAVFNLVTAGPPDKVAPGLERVARTLNLFASAGVPLSRLHFVAVVHGPATASVLDDEHYRAKFGTDNPNTAVIAELDRAGVKVVVCGQALAHFQYPEAWVNTKVEVTLAALVDLIILQQQGYALVPL